MFVGEQPTQTPAVQQPTTVRPRTAVVLVAGLLALMFALAISLAPLPFVVYRPGPVLNTLGEVDGKPLISVSGRPTYPTSGQLDLTTVSVLGGPGHPVSLPALLYAWADSGATVLRRDDVFPPDTTEAQNEELNEAEMVSSQESATVAALQELGIRVPATLEVVAVSEQTPSAGKLAVGDVIVSAAGRPVDGMAALSQQVRRVRPGQDLVLQVRRKGATRSITTSTVLDRQGKPILGVWLAPRFRLPFTVTIRIEDIGGPSAGTMFALGLIDYLTPGALTGGRRIAGTGTMDADGTVGGIGGIRQKMLGARGAGAQYFLAPAVNCPEVRGQVPEGLQVVRVSDLGQARAAVERIGAGRAAGLPSC